MSAPRPVLAFDFGSPVASAALALAGAPLAARAVPRDADGDLLRLVAAVLADAGVAPRDLGGAVALAGPGSFTGVRIACATTLALGAAWPLAIGAVSTPAALARCAPPDAGAVLAVIDALRGEWFVQRFGRAAADGARPAAGEVELWRAGGSPAPPADLVVGFDAERFAALAGATAELLTPPLLAAPTALAASRPEWIWDRALLTRPLHLRAPATTRPRA